MSDTSILLNKALTLLLYLALVVALWRLKDKSCSRPVYVFLFSLLIMVGFVMALASDLETALYYLACWPGGWCTEYPYRFLSPLNNSNVYMALMNLLAPLVLVLAIRAREWTTRAVLLAWLALFVISIPFSSSRGGWVALLIGAAVLAFLRFYKYINWHKALYVLPLALAVFVLAGWLFYQRFAVNPTHGQTLQDSRLVFWSHALTIWQRSPIVGTGLGSYLREFQQLGYGPDVFQEYHAHSMPLTILAETGLLGLAVYLTLTSVLWWLVVRGYRRSPDLSSGAILAGLVAFQVHSLVDDFTMIIPIMVAVVVLACFVSKGESL